MHRSKLERETIIGWNEEDEKGWINTTSPGVYKRLKARIGAPTRELSTGSWTWDIPKEWIKLPNKLRHRVGKPLSEEHKAKLLKGRKREKLPV